MDTDKAIGAKIQLFRESKGLSQSEMAKRLREADINWAQGTLSKVEAGVRPVRLAEAAKLAFALGIELDELTAISSQITREFDKASYTERRLAAQLEELTYEMKGIRAVRRTLQLLHELSEGKKGPYRVNGSPAWLLNFRHTSDGTGHIYVPTRLAVAEAGVPSDALDRADEEIHRVFLRWQEADADMAIVAADLSSDNQPTADELQHLHGGPVLEARNRLLDRLQSELYGRALETAFPQITFSHGNDSEPELEITGLDDEDPLGAVSQSGVD